MAEPLHEGKTVWKTSEFGEDQDQVHGSIISALRLIFQNISDQLYRYQHNHPFPSKTSVVYEMKNLTFALLSDNYSISDPSFESILETVILVRTFLQYFITLVVLLATTWIFNKFIFKSNLVTNVVETVGSYLIFLPVLPPIAAFFGVLFLVRTSVWVYLKIMYGSKGRLSLVNPLDSFWAFETHASCSACVGLYVIEGTCDPKKIRERTKKTVESDLVRGKMSRKLTSVLGFPCWETIEQMDMEDYVKVVLDTGNPCSESEVFEFLKSIQDHPIVDRAPWEVYIIPNFSYEKNSSSSNNNSADSENNSKPHYATVFRIHHGVMDGVSTGNILHSVMADEPFKFSVDPIEPSSGRKSSGFTSILGSIIGLLSLPRVSLRNIFLTDNKHNRFYLPGPRLTGPKSFTWSRPIKMDGLKHLKNSTKTSVFNVLLTSLGGAYRQLYLKNGKVPETDFFHTMTPVALMPYPDRSPRNGFSAILTPVFVGKEGDILRKLEINHENITKIGTTVGNAMVMGNYFFPMMVGLMPLFLQKIFSSLVHVKMSISNVPGPMEKVKIYNGDKITDIGIWVPIKLTIGLGMGLFSYGDRVRATVIGDKVYFPNDSDVQFIAEAFEKELTSLAQAVGLPENLLFI